MNILSMKMKLPLMNSFTHSSVEITLCEKPRTDKPLTFTALHLQITNVKQNIIIMPCEGGGDKEMRVMDCLWFFR